MVTCVRALWRLINEILVGSVFFELLKWWCHRAGMQSFRECPWYFFVLSGCLNFYYACLGLAVRNLKYAGGHFLKYVLPSPVTINKKQGSSFRFIFLHRGRTNSSHIVIFICCLAWSNEDVFQLISYYYPAWGLFNAPSAICSHELMKCGFSEVAL